MRTGTPRRVSHRARTRPVGPAPATRTFAGDTPTPPCKGRAAGGSSDRSNCTYREYQAARIRRRASGGEDQAQTAAEVGEAERHYRPARPGAERGVADALEHLPGERGADERKHHHRRD